MNQNKGNRILKIILDSIFLLLLFALLVGVVALRVQTEKQPPILPAATPAPVGEGASVTLFEAAPAVTPAPTPTPTPEPTPVPEPEYFTLSFVGDCTLAEDSSKQGWATAYTSVVGKDYSYPFANTVQYFADDYMTLANLECTLTDKRYSSIEWYSFLAPSAYVNIMLEGAVDFVTLANNHVQDFGSAAYGDMITTLQSAGLPYAGENETYVFERGGGLKVGVYCLYNDKQPTRELLDQGLRKLKEAGAEFTIAALHWGVEGAYSVSDTQVTMGHYAIDTGFNMVYGCHSHRLEPVEQYNGGVILYSMANWSFGGHTNPDDYDTAIAQITVKRLGSETSIDGMKLIPCSISSSAHNHAGHSSADNCLNNYQPTPYEEDSEDWKRALSKLDGTYEGADYKPDYQSLIYGTS